MSETLLITLRDMGLDHHKVSGLVVDNRDAARKIDLWDSCLKHVCVTHRLHETLRKAFQRGLDADSSLASLFTSAMAAARLLLNVPQIPETITSRSPLPWNSLLHDLEVFRWMRVPLTALLGDGGRVELQSLCHPSAFPLIEQFIAVLNKFKSAIATTRALTKPTLHHVVTIVLNLKRDLRTRCESDEIDDQVKAILQLLLTELEAQFGSFSDLEKMAFVLNPLLKDPRDNSEWSIYYNEGVEALRKIDYEPVNLPPPVINKNDALSLPPACIRSHHMYSASIDTELGYYTKTAPPSTDSDLLAWWSSNASFYPRLSSMAKRLLCISASHYTSPKDLTFMKLICAERRTSLPFVTEPQQLISQFAALRHCEFYAGAKARVAYAETNFSADFEQEARTRKLVSHRNFALPPDHDSSDYHYASEEKDVFIANDSEVKESEEGGASKKRQQDALPEDTPERYAASVHDQTTSEEDDAEPELEPSVVFDSCDSAGELIFAFFGNVSPKFVPKWKSILGDYYHLFCDFAPVPHCTYPIVQWSMKLSADGKSHFGMGRREAVDWIGKLPTSTHLK